MKIVELTQGQVTVVDDHHYEWISKHKWFAHKKKYGGYYASRNSSSLIGKRKTIRLHREIMEHTLGRPLTDDEEVDHIDLDKLNNLDENLRLATSGENARNKTKHSDNTSGYRGVSWYRWYQKWVAAITINYKKIYLGYHKSKEDAARAYDLAAIEHHGNFAKTNFPKEDYLAE